MDLENITAADLYHENEQKTDYIDWRCNIDP